MNDSSRGKRPGLNGADRSRRYAYNKSAMASQARSSVKRDSSRSDHDKRVTFAVPGDISTPTGGYGYDRRIIRELRRLGWRIDLLDVGDTFPFPNTEERAAAFNVLAAAPPDIPLIVDGLALGALPEVSQLSRRAPLISLLHLPLAFDPGLDDHRARLLLESERAALSATQGVIVTSATTARIVTDHYKVSDEIVTVVKPGTDRAPPAFGCHDGVVRLVSVGSVVPVKGYDVLIESIAALKDLPWQLTIAGDTTRDRETAFRLYTDIAAYGLKDRVRVLGAVPSERVHELLSESDIFVLASRFESYGMALAEAIAHGLPVVSTKAGAIPNTVAMGSGLLVPPDNAAALGDALRYLICSAPARAGIAANARRAAAALPTWRDSANLFEGALRTIQHAGKMPRRKIAAFDSPADDATERTLETYQTRTLSATPPLRDPL